MRKILLVFITLWLIVPVIYAQKVGLVLSGSGAKGLTHIGIIRALEENNIPIDYIAGTSMGADRKSTRLNSSHPSSSRMPSSA